MRTHSLLSWQCGKVGQRRLCNIGKTSPSISSIFRLSFFVCLLKQLGCSIFPENCQVIGGGESVSTKTSWKENSLQHMELETNYMTTAARCRQSLPKSLNRVLSFTRKWSCFAAIPQDDPYSCFEYSAPSLIRGFPLWLQDHIQTIEGHSSGNGSAFGFLQNLSSNGERSVKLFDRFHKKKLDLLSDSMILKQTRSSIRFPIFQFLIRTISKR